MIGLAALAASGGLGQASDHVDSPTPMGNPMADITDVYAWMTGANLNLVMDVSPGDDGTQVFDDKTLYVFHLTSKSGLGVGQSGGTETRVICRFASNTAVECWAVSGATTKDYVAGNPSNATGVTSADGKLRVFAGRRSDPFFFNRGGFTTGTGDLANLLPGSTPTGAQCPLLDARAGEVNTLRGRMATGMDDYAGANVMAIVVQIDRALVNVSNNTVVAVWGATHAAAM